MGYLDHDGLSYFWSKVKGKLGALAWKSTVAKSDLVQAVQTSLGKADSALQSYTESDPTVPSWAKAASKPSYTASEVGAAPASHSHSAGDISEGTLPIARGGTGAGTSAEARTNIGAAAKQVVVPITLTVAGWNASTKRQVASVTGVLADASLQVIQMGFSTEAAILAYGAAGILAVAQGANSLTFQCSTVPTEAIAVNIIIQAL